MEASERPSSGSAAADATRRREGPRGTRCECRAARGYSGVCGHRRVIDGATIIGDDLLAPVPKALEDQAVMVSPPPLAQEQGPVRAAHSIGPGAHGKVLVRLINPQAEPRLQFQL